MREGRGQVVSREDAKCMLILCPNWPIPLGTATQISAFLPQSEDVLEILLCQFRQHFWQFVLGLHYVACPCPCSFIFILGKRGLMRVSRSNALRSLGTNILAIHVMLSSSDKIRCHVSYGSITMLQATGIKASFTRSSNISQHAR